MVISYRDYLQSLTPIRDQDAFLADLAYTLSEKRSHLQWKSFAVASSIGDLRQTLDCGSLTAIRSSPSPNLGFVFTGQGAQWYAMGRELLDYPVFRRSLEEAEAFFQTLGCRWTLIGMQIFKLIFPSANTLKTNSYGIKSLPN